MNDITEADIFAQVDQVVEQAVVVGDPEMIFSFGINLRRALTARGYALAKLLYKAQEIWKVFNLEGEFEDIIFSRIGLTRQTVVKYCRLWKNVFMNPAIPQDVKDKLMGRNIRDVMLLSAGAADGTLGADVLREAAAMPDSESMRKVIRDARGTHTSSSTAIHLSVVMRSDNSKFRRGTVLGFQEGSPQFEIGWLNVDSTDPLVVASINRILSGASIQES